MENDIKKVIGVSAICPTELVYQLRSVAQENGRSMSSEIRRALQAHVAQNSNGWSRY